MKDEIVDIQNLSQDELFEIFESIPSDDESICDDYFLLDEQEEIWSAEVNNYSIYLFYFKTFGLSNCLHNLG